MDSCHHTPTITNPPSQSLHTKSRIERRRFALPLVFWGGGALFWCCPLRSGFQEESLRKSLDHRELFDFADCHTVIPLRRKTGAQNDCADFFPHFSWSCSPRRKQKPKEVSWTELWHATPPDLVRRRGVSRLINITLPLCDVKS